MKHGHISHKNIFEEHRRSASKVHAKKSAEYAPLIKRTIETLSTIGLTQRLGIWVMATLVTLFAAHSQADLIKTKLALNWKPEPQFGGFYAADVEGYFAKAGLNVEILPGGSGTPTVQMVAAGSVDFAVVSADEVILSQSKGSDVVALFATYQTNPQGIMVHAERGFKSLDDVFNHEGTLAWQAGLPYALYLKKKFAHPKVKLVPYLGGISNFMNDSNFSQQCFVTSEPLSAKKANAKAQTFLVADAGYNPYTTVLVTRHRVLKENREMVAKVVQAVREGWQKYLDAPEKTNMKMSELNKAMDLATFVESAQAQKPLIATKEKSALGAMTSERWSELAKQMKDLGLIQKVPDSQNLFQNL